MTHAIKIRCKFLQNWKLATSLVLFSTLLAFSSHSFSQNLVTNPGFENGTNGWSLEDDASAQYTESSGRSGDRLTHWSSSSSYRAETTQTVMGLSAGTYRLSAYTVGGETSGAWLWAYCDGQSYTTTIPSSPWGSWAEVVVDDIEVSGSSCELGITTEDSEWSSFDDVVFERVSSGGGTEVVIEENTSGFCSVDGTVDSNHSGYNGSGFANTDNAEGDGVDWEIEVSQAGSYTLQWRYSNGGENDRPGDLYIDGQVEYQGVSFPTTGSWSSWADSQTVELWLDQGSHTVRLDAVASAGLGNVDNFTITGSSVSAKDCGGSPPDGDGDDGDYYVSLDGNDSNSGSLNQPFRTLQKAIDAAGPGDLVYVRGGVYNISNPAIPEAGVNFWKSGTSDSNRIRYFAYPGERPVLDFSNLQIRPDPNYTFGVLVTGSYLHLKGFEIRNVPMNTRSNVGLRVAGNDAYRNIFELLDIHHNAGAGVFVHTTRGGHLFLNSDSHDNYDPWSHQGDGENADGFGVHYQWQGEPTVFRGCRAWWNSDDGWDYISQEVPVITENSWAWGNGYANEGTHAAGNGAGFKIGSSKDGIRHVVRNNVAWGNRNQGFYANHSSGGNDWYNNTSFNNRIQYDMLASSWDSNGNRTDGVILTGSQRHRMRNNIAYPHDNRNMAGVDEQYNTWNLSITPNSGDFLSTSDDGFRGPRQADGSLPDIDFMKLSSGSQMIDRGVDVGLPYSGSAPDLGAYER